MSVIGLRVGPFEVREPIRVPEAGDWYLAVRTGSGGGGRQRPSEVLVKLLDGSEGTAERTSMQAEFDTLRGLEGRRLPSPVAFYDGLGALAVAAPRCVPLSRLVAERKSDRIQLSPATLLDLALDLAETLQSAHHRGRVHGHLSPDVIGLAPDGRLWIFGYGIGPWAGAVEEWSAPERARGELGQAADQWALGGVLAALVTGSHTTDVGAIEGQWPALGRVVRRLLDPVPAHRYPNFPAVRQELFALARRAGAASDRRDLAARLHRLHPDRSAAYEAPVLFVPVASGPEPELDDDPVLPQHDEPAHIPVPEPEDLETVEVVRADRPAARPDPVSDPACELAPARVLPTRRKSSRAALPRSEQIPVVRVTLPDAPLLPASGDPASAPDPALAGTGTGTPLLRVGAGASAPGPERIADPSLLLDAIPTDRAAPPRLSAPSPPELPVNRSSAPAVPAPVPRIAIPGPTATVQIEYDEADIAPLLPDEETDGFHLPPEMVGRSTALPGGPTEPELALRGPYVSSPLSLDFAGPGASSEAASQGDSWFGSSGPPDRQLRASEAPTIPLPEPTSSPFGDRDDALPLRIPEHRPGMGQRLAPIALATMAVSLGVWTVVQFLA